MSRYFFNVRDGKDLPDMEGTELPDIGAVRNEAIRAAGEMLRDLGEQWEGEAWQMNVTDLNGQTVFKLNFSAETPDDVSEAAE